MKFITLFAFFLAISLTTTGASATCGSLLDFDLNGDGTVDPEEDSRYYDGNLGVTVGHPAYNPKADVDRSGKITIIDKLRWQVRYATCLDSFLDVNRDGEVSGEDLAHIVALIGVHSWHVQYDPNADLDASGKITARDGNLWRDAYGGDPGPPTPGDGIPAAEPYTHLDVNGDGFINGQDLARIEAARGTRYWLHNFDSRSDLDSDGEVDQVDINLWNDEYAALQLPDNSCDRIRNGLQSYADYVQAALDTGTEAAAREALRIRTECDGAEPFVLVPGDIVYDSDGAISILRDGASHQLTMRLSGIQHIETSGQSIIYSVELFEGSDLALLQLFPDGHQEIVLHPGPSAFSVAD